MYFKVIEKQLLIAIDTFSARLLTERVECMKELVHAGEPGVAFEILCENLFEFDVYPDDVMFSRLERIGMAMKIEPDCWECLRPKDR